MRKEIRVQLYRGENDDYVELWKVVGEKKYYGRYTYNDEGTWYTVCDPLGYCELNTTVSKEITFIICDCNGKELFRHRNGEPNPLPKFDTFVKMQWAKVQANIPHNTEDESKNFWSMCFNGETTTKLNQWLVSFKDPDIYEKEIRDMHGYDENWYGCWHNKETDYTPIPDSEFEYLGNKYQFIKVHHKHDVCGVEWDTFECCDSPLEMSICGTETHPFVQSYMEMGNWFDDSKYGTMYDSKTARTKVLQSLKALYPKESDWSTLLFVKLGNGGQWSADYCYEKNYHDVAEMLIDGDYHVKSISSLIKNLKTKTANKVFPCNRENKEKIKQLYPNIYGYDYCLI